MKAIGVVVMTQYAITFPLPVKLTLWYRMGGHAVYNIPYYPKYPARIHWGLKIRWQQESLHKCMMKKSKKSKKISSPITSRSIALIHVHIPQYIFKIAYKSCFNYFTLLHTNILFMIKQNAWFLDHFSCSLYLYLGRWTITRLSSMLIKTLSKQLVSKYKYTEIANGFSSTSFAEVLLQH